MNRKKYKQKEFVIPKTGLFEICDQRTWDFIRSLKMVQFQDERAQKNTKQEP